MELVTALIWLLRILLPVVLFWIYFKSQSSKQDQYLTAGPGPDYISKRRLLACRAAVAASEAAPEALRDINLKGPSEAPELFAGTPARLTRGSRRAEGGAQRPRRERPDGERRSGRRQPATGITVATEPLQETTEAQRRLHLESLVNYVAFNHREQQRTFLVDEASAPPPPPKRRAGAPATGGASEDSAKANAEAQIVLSGALRFKRAEVARSLLEQLTESQVEISDETYTLMIQTALAAADLKCASDFLMKMESAGCCPDAGLLDQVMDLYAQQKSRREQERQAAQAAEQSGVMLEAAFMQGVMDWAPIEEFMRTKLSSAAPAFVPRGEVADGHTDDDDEGGETDEGTASAEPASRDPTASAEVAAPAAPVVQRTKLTSSAKPFAPSWLH